MTSLGEPGKKKVYGYMPFLGCGVRDSKINDHGLQELSYFVSPTKRAIEYITPDNIYRRHKHHDYEQDSPHLVQPSA